MTIAGIGQQPVVVQVALIVRDAEAMARRYAEIFGFTQSDFQTTLTHEHTDATYHGQPTDARASIAFFNIGQIQFEMIQPLDAPSVWKDQLDQHGEGIHHIAFFSTDTRATVESFAAHGYGVTQQGLYTGRGGMYTYLNTERDMGITLELLESFNGNPTFNAPSFDQALGLGTDRIVQVGLIVRDIDATAKRFVDVLGLPLPGIMITPGYEQVETTFHGQPSDATAKLAFFNCGQVTIELIEPDEKPSTWREFLDQHGEGAHHIAFVVENTQRALDHLAQFGIPLAQQGLYSDRSGIYSYVDSAPVLGTTLELLESFKK